MLKYYIFQIEWNQTDHEMRIVQAESREAAEQFLKRNGTNGPRYVSYYGQVDSIVKLNK